MCDSKMLGKIGWVPMALLLAGGALTWSANAADPAVEGTVTEPAAATMEVIIEPAAEETVAEPAAATEVIITVDEQKLTRADYARETDDIANMMKKRGVPAEQFEQLVKTFKPQIVEGLVTRALINQACEKNEIKISDAEMTEKIAGFEKNLPKSMTLEALLKQSGLTRAMFENDIREQLKLEKLLQVKSATEEQVIAYYEENKARFFEQPEMVQARHILFATKPHDTDEQKQEKRAQAEKVLEQIKQDNADFAKLAEANSDCPSKASGGDLGEFRRGQMVKEFEDKAFTMKDNEISDLVETQFGYHIIQTLGHTQPKTMALDEVRGRIAEALKGREIQEKAESFLADMRKAAKITYIDEFDPAQAPAPASPFMPAMEGVSADNEDASASDEDASASDEDASDDKPAAQDDK